MRECLDRYSGLVWSLARRFLGTSSEAEDAVQEIFIELWRSAGRFNAETASEATFIATIARRRLIDRLRKRSREPRVDALGPDSTVAMPELTPTTDTDDEAARVLKQVATLPKEKREVLLLSIYHGLTHREIAERTSLPLGTVKTHVRRGLMQVRELLGFGREQQSPGVQS